MPDISVKEFFEKKETGWSHVLLDVRNKDEWDAGHIDGSQLLPLPLIPLRIKEFAPDQHVPIVVYCQSGGRSGLAAKALESMGYRQVFNLEGGYTAVRAMR